LVIDPRAISSVPIKIAANASKNNRLAKPSREG
jgi:hypothetical protein